MPWNKGKLLGQKLPLKLKEIRAIRVRLQLATNRRDLALFKLSIDSKLGGSDLVKMQVSDISNTGVVSARAMVLQQKNGENHLAVVLHILVLYAVGTHLPVTQGILNGNDSLSSAA